MNNWNPPPANNQSNGNNPPPPRTGGLLSSYNQQSKPGTSPSQVPPRTPATTPRANLPVPQPQGGRQPASGLLSSHRAGLMANTMQAMRSWSGKVASIAGHNIRPPEAPMELYHPRNNELPESSQPLRATPWKRSRTQRIIRRMHNRRERWQRSHLSVGRVWGIILVVFTLLIVITSASGTAYGYTYYQNQQPQVQRLANLQVPQTTRIYDRNGVLLYNAYDANKGGRSTPVAYSDLPQVLQDALIDTEDHTFMTNIGIDPLAIIRAASDNYGGASGITQQVVKNMLNGNKVIVSRGINDKITEAALAIGLTQQFSKAKILQMYFDIVPFGSQELGVEAAVEDYFGLMPQCDANFKCVPGVKRLDYESDAKPHNPLLELARASLLAGIPNAPSSFDPRTDAAHKQAALARQDHVLNLMLSFGSSYGGGLITPKVVKDAEALTAQMNFAPYQYFKKAPHFVDWVMDQVKAALGNGDVNAGTEPFLTGGFNIQTTIDSNLETYVESAVTRHLTQPEYLQFIPGDYGPLNKPNGHNVNDAAVVVMNAKTGEVLAMDGSADYNSTDPKVAGSVNAATSGRQPGSSFKPLVYATTFEQGWYPGIVVSDARTYFPNGHGVGTSIPTEAQIKAGNPTVLDQLMYAPSDYDRRFHTDLDTGQPTTIHYATENSFNIPAVKAIQFAGIDNVVATAERMGIRAVQSKLIKCGNQTASQCFGVSMVLGTTDVPLLQMTDAYQTFADYGSHVPAQGILNIWDNYGHNLFHFDPAHPAVSQAMSPQVAYMMTSILTDEKARRQEFGYDHDLSFGDRYPSCVYDNVNCPYQVAAKTGTSDNFVDNWTIGYTPNVVVGVWAGNADGTPMSNVVGITGAGPIWHSVMEFASNGWCNQAVDQVPCTNVDRTKLGLGDQATFAPAAGLIHQCVNSYNGLAGGGANCDWMPANAVPQQAGMPPAPVTPTNNGNPPKP